MPLGEHNRPTPEDVVVYPWVEPHDGESYQEWKARMEERLNAEQSVSPDTLSVDGVPSHFMAYMDIYRQLDERFWRFLGGVPKIPDLRGDVDWPAILPAVRLGPFTMSMLMTHVAHAVNLAGAIAVGNWDVGKMGFDRGEYGDPFMTAKIGIAAIRKQGRTGELLQWANHQQGLLDAAVLATGYRFDV